MNCNTTKFESGRWNCRWGNKGRKWGTKEISVDIRKSLSYTSSIIHDPQSVYLLKIVSFLQSKTFVDSFIAQLSLHIKKEAPFPQDTKDLFMYENNRKMKLIFQKL